MCFQKKQERCHFILTSCDCDFVFVLLLYFWVGGGEGWRAGIERLVFDSHEHTYLVCQSLPAAGPAHVLAWIVPSSSANNLVRRRDETASVKGYSWRSVSLNYYLIVLLKLYCVILSFASPTIHQGLETQNASWVFVSLCMCVLFCFFPVLFAAISD